MALAALMQVLAPRHTASRPVPGPCSLEILMERAIYHHWLSKAEQPYWAQMMRFDLQY